MTRREPVRTPSNDLYRIPEPEDLKPGLELIMSDQNDPRDQDPARVGTRIRIDKIVPSNGRPGVTVYYHCINPAWDHQCFVPAEQIVQLPTGRERRILDDGTRYYLPREFAP
jgi:hypothetical protein